MVIVRYKLLCCSVTVKLLVVFSLDIKSQLLFKSVILSLLNKVHVKLHVYVF